MNNDHHKGLESNHPDITLMHSRSHKNILEDIAILWDKKHRDGGVG